VTDAQGRTWIGEAKAAFDQAYTQVASSREDTVPPAEFWLQRAQAAAAIESAEQARIANLIAWKQLQATRQSSADAGVAMLPLGSPDDATVEIERAIGLEP
jgi:hypothetical protein